MRLYSIYDSEFKKYGQILDFNFFSLLNKLKNTPLPCNHTIYIPSDTNLEKDNSFNYLKNNIFGGLDIQIGYCNGFNKTLNCLEYHNCIEINIPTTNIILLLGKINEIENGNYDTSNVKAFLVPAGVGVELFQTTLHYAPISEKSDSFQVAIVLLKGTNLEKPLSSDPLLWNCNKWLLAHKDSPEAKLGAYVGLCGENIKL